MRPLIFLFFLCLISAARSAPILVKTSYFQKAVEFQNYAHGKIEMSRYGYFKITTFSGEEYVVDLGHGQNTFHNMQVDPTGTKVAFFKKEDLGGYRPQTEYKVMVIDLNSKQLVASYSLGLNNFHEWTVYWDMAGKSFLLQAIGNKLEEYQIQGSQISKREFELEAPPALPFLYEFKPKGDFDPGTSAVTLQELDQKHQIAVQMKVFYPLRSWTTKSKEFSPAHIFAWDLQTKRIKWVLNRGDFPHEGTLGQSLQHSYENIILTSENSKTLVALKAGPKVLLLDGENGEVLKELTTPYPEEPLLTTLLRDDVQNIPELKTEGDDFKVDGVDVATVLRSDEKVIRVYLTPDHFAQLQGDSRIRDRFDSVRSVDIPFTAENYLFLRVLIQESARNYKNLFTYRIKYRRMHGTCEGLASTE